MNKSRTKAKLRNNKPDCHCQSGLLFEQCCQRFLELPLSHFAKTAEQLMRSRYCAYVLSDETYLLSTWHPKSRPEKLHLEHSNSHWIGLKIKSTTLGQENDSSGTVHFIARYKENGKAHKLEENSQFEKKDGRWFYVTGTFSK